MGCSASKEAAIKELQQIVDQLTSENQILEKEKAKLESQKTEKPQEEKNTLGDITNMHSRLENEVKSLEDLANEMFKSSKESKNALNEQISGLLEIKQKLDKRSETIKEMINEREYLRKQHHELEGQISESELKIKEIESVYFTSEELRFKHHTLHLKVSKLESKKEELLGEIELAESVLQDLQEESKVSGVDNNLKVRDLSNYELLLSLSDQEVNTELKKVDAELEELTEQMRILKNRENELNDFESYAPKSQSRLSILKSDSLKEQIRSSQERVEMLELEKNKVKVDIDRLRRNTTNDGLGEKLNILNGIIEKKRVKEESSKVVSESLVTDIEKTLKKAKMLTFKDS